MRKNAIVLVSVALAFCFGFLAGAGRPQPSSTFHDMIVGQPEDLSALITPHDHRIQALASRLKTPEEAFVFVRDRIRNDAARPALPAGDILDEGWASCLGKSILLCSIYRAMGVPAAEVRVVTGEVESPYGIVDHAWVEMEHDGVCIQQDASDLIGIFGFDQFRNTDYTRTFIRREGYAFNDHDFVIVSRLNRYRGGEQPKPR